MYDYIDYMCFNNNTFQIKMCSSIKFCAGNYQFFSFNNQLQFQIPIALHVLTTGAGGVGEA